MKYCYNCGGLLKPEFLNQREGMVPKCTMCGKYQFPVFSTAVSMIVLNPSQDKILLIQQYGNTDNILVAGYISKGENAETAAAREIKEETGLDISAVTYNKSEYFAKTNTLMINFVCIASDADLSLIDREEVDHAEWFSFDQARKNIKHHSLAEKFLVYYLDSQQSCFQ